MVCQRQEKKLLAGSYRCNTTHTPRSSFSTASTNPLTPTSLRCPNLPTFTLPNTSVFSSYFSSTFVGPSLSVFSISRSLSSSKKVLPPRLAFSILLLISAISSARLSLAIELASSLSLMTPFTPVLPGPIPIESCGDSIGWRCWPFSFPPYQPASGDGVRTGEDEGEFENSLPDRTRSSISAYYSLSLYVFVEKGLETRMLTMMSLRTWGNDSWEFTSIYQICK